MSEKTIGEKLRTIAVLLCKEKQFWDFLNATSYDGVISQQHAVECLYDYCDIESRGELAYNVHAQERFKELDREYMQWANLDSQYADNFSR